MSAVGGSIPLTTTISPTRHAEISLRGHRPRPTVRAARSAHPLQFKPSLEKRMLKFLGSTVGIIFLIGLVVVILLLKFIF